MWSSLIPLILGGALEPIEIMITIMLLGTPAGARAAGAWISGHVGTRLLQGLIFGTILHWGARGGDSKHSWRIMQMSSNGEVPKHSKTPRITRCAISGFLKPMEMR